MMSDEGMRCMESREMSRLPGATSTTTSVRRDSTLPALIGGSTALEGGGVSRVPLVAAAVSIRHPIHVVRNWGRGIAGADSFRSSRSVDG